MKVIKKYTAIQLYSKNIQNRVDVELSYGGITGPYYSLDYPQEEFDSEEDAIEYAHKTYKWGRWLILPVVKFE
jgi:hypothetical protein